MTQEAQTIRDLLLPKDSSPIHMDTRSMGSQSNDMHLYWQDKNKETAYPSVTSVLDIVSYNRYLMRWANSLGFRRMKYEEELQKKADIGTFMHAHAQHIVDKEHYPDEPKVDDALTDYYVRKRIQSLKYRLSNEVWETVASEIPVISHTKKIGGTIDWVAFTHAGLTLSDFKSSAQMREKFLLQLGGYHMILYTDYGIKVDAGNILLCKEDRCHIYEFTQMMLDDAAASFQHVLDYFNSYELIKQYCADKSRERKLTVISTPDNEIKAQ